MAAIFPRGARAIEIIRDPRLYPAPRSGDRMMFDAAMVALGVAFFVMGILYTAACNRL